MSATGLNAEQDPSTAAWAASQPDSQATGTYVLAPTGAEQAAPEPAARVWLSSAQEAWAGPSAEGNGLVLDLGAVRDSSPGARPPGGSRRAGVFWPLDSSAPPTGGRPRSAAEAGLAQLASPPHEPSALIPLPQDFGFDLVWCRLRWTMFLAVALQPLLDQLAATLKTGGNGCCFTKRALEHFGLHPMATRSPVSVPPPWPVFVAAAAIPECVQTPAAGRWLAARGVRIDALRPLPLLGSPEGMLGMPWRNWLGELRGCRMAAS